MTHELNHVKTEAAIWAAGTRFTANDLYQEFLRANGRDPEANPQTVFHELLESVGYSAENDWADAQEITGE